MKETNHKRKYKKLFLKRKKNIQRTPMNFGHVIKEVAFIPKLDVPDSRCLPPDPLSACEALNALREADLCGLHP